MNIRYFFIFSITLIGSCYNKQPDSAKLYSIDFENKSERIKKLSGVIKVFSEIKDAEFELFNVNGFPDQRLTVPGASSWDYKFAISINREDIPKWTEGMKDTIMTDYDYRWAQKIVKHRSQFWKLNSSPKYYVREGENVIMIVYEDEGTVFKHISEL